MWPLVVAGRLIANVIVAAKLSRICVQTIATEPRHYGYWTSAQRTADVCPANNFAWQPYTGFGNLVTYTAWKPSEPSCQASNLEKCLALSPATTSLSTQYWVDVKCDSLLCPFCQLDL